MKREELAAMDGKALKKRFRSHIITSSLLTLIVIAMCLKAFVFGEDSSTASKIIPFGFLPLVALAVQDYNRMKKELRSRQRE